jgi:hypothetical protein
VGTHTPHLPVHLPQGQTAAGTSTGVRKGQKPLMQGDNEGRGLVWLSLQHCPGSPQRHVQHQGFQAEPESGALSPHSSSQPPMVPLLYYK